MTIEELEEIVEVLAMVVDSTDLIIEFELDGRDLKRHEELLEVAKKELAVRRAAARS